VGSNPTPSANYMQGVECYARYVFAHQNFPDDCLCDLPPFPALPFLHRGGWSLILT
jgi:hypothetical protein